MNEAHSVLQDGTEAHVDAVPDEITYLPGASKQPWLYDNAPIFSVILFSLAVVVLCTVLLLDANPLSRVSGAVAAVAFALYVGRYGYHFRKSRSLVTRKAQLKDGLLTVSCDKWTKTVPLSELVFTMSYSSSTNLCILVATETDYLTIHCSCGYLLSKGGLQVLQPFYAINKAMMRLNPNHINYVKNKRYRRKNPFRIPLYVFEVEYDTPRVDKLVESLRQTYRFSTHTPEKGAMSQ